MIEIKKLNKSYGTKAALKNISFTVNEGDILGFLGPNGAGKSTTMNIISGYISSTSGTAIIDGYDILEKPLEAKSKIGYLPEIPPLYPDMTVKSYLGFVFDLKNIDQPKWEHIQNICEEVKITDVYNRLIKNLSKGYKQRVGLAQALLGDPKLLILDEPTVGLDPKQIIEIRNLIKGLSERHTVILSSHVLHEIQAICNRIIIINNGEIVADDTTENLAKNLVTSKAYIVTVEGDETAIVNVLKTISGVKNILNNGEIENGVFEFCVEADNDIRRIIVSSLENSGFSILGLKSTTANLEDIFMKLISDSADKQESSLKKDEEIDKESNYEEAAEEKEYITDNLSDENNELNNETSTKNGGMSK